MHPASKAWQRNNKATTAEFWCLVKQWRPANQETVRKNWLDYYAENGEELRRVKRECPQARAAATEARMRRVAAQKRATLSGLEGKDFYQVYLERELLSCKHGKTYHVDCCNGTLHAQGIGKIRAT